MRSGNLLENQEANRRHYLNAILGSRSPRKLIVAGPGTGKTHAFGELVKRTPPGKKLALTFIRKLVADMNREFGQVAEVKTFHGYCKMLLHQRYGAIDLIPFLTLVVQEDARAMRSGLSHFTRAFQTLQVAGEEIAFYLARGNYYRAVSFDDSVFRVLQAVSEGTLQLPTYSQIVIDEFQDFNPLEVTLIDLLQHQGPILIVGDDDQAVYSIRNASPQYLRERYHSREYELFELPYCSRCPRVVVEATAAFVASVVEAGGLAARIDRPFVPFLEDKAYENALYPKLITATTANIAGVACFIRKAIGRIPAEDIGHAHDNDYPCVLVVGQRQYLNPIYNILRRHFPRIAFSQAEEIAYSLPDGYELLLADEHSNLGWRVLAGCDMAYAQFRPLVAATREGAGLRALLPAGFVARHLRVLRMLRAQVVGETEQRTLTRLLADRAGSVIDRFFPPEVPPEPEQEPQHLTILLSSFEGCKGLSAGHVFIVGLNAGEIPRLQPGAPIPDIEYCKFIVAMTRARKSLFLLSNRYRDRPSGLPLRPSPLVQMIPSAFRTDAGYLTANEMDAFLQGSWPAPH